MYDFIVSVPNPDDQFAPPIYEGRVWGAADRLIPGAYRATVDLTDLTGDPDDESERPGWLVVWDKSVVGRFVIDHPADRGASWDDDEFPAIMDYMNK